MFCSYFDLFFEKELEVGGDGYLISFVYLKYWCIYELMWDLWFVGIVMVLFGEDVVGWGVYFFCKFLGDFKWVDWY